MDRSKAECLVLVSDDSDFVGVLKEAKQRCLKTVVVGDVDDGALKRVADAGFSWTEILMGKAKKEAISVVGKWKNRDILKRREWTYNPEVGRKLNGCEYLFDFDDESEDKDFDNTDDENNCDSGEIPQGCTIGYRNDNNWEMLRRGQLGCSGGECSD
ncbi:hypothetical protein V6N13_096109 [Hibiscus sabdariffa]